MGTARITLTCATCAQQFQCYRSQNTDGRRRYCSAACRLRGLHQEQCDRLQGAQPPQLRRERRTALCLYCGNEFWQKQIMQRFCSIACANKGKPPRTPKTVRISSRKRTDAFRSLHVPCDWCGKPLLLAAWQRKRVAHHFCVEDGHACYKAWLRVNRRGTNHPSYGKAPSTRAGRGRGCFDADLGHYVRSTWERNIAHWLLDHGYSYQYEPMRFFFDDFSYLPDFYVPALDRYIEVKGVMSTEARKKIDAFRVLHPTLWLIDAGEYARLGFDPQETR